MVYPLALTGLAGVVEEEERSVRGVLCAVPIWGERGLGVKVEWSREGMSLRGMSWRAPDIMALLLEDMVLLG